MRGGERLIRDRNIVCVASNWFDHPTSKHHVMRLLAERNHVLWVNYLASRRPKLTGSDRGVIIKRLRQACAGPRRVSSTIDVLSPLLVPMPESRIARAVNARALAGQVKAALRQLPRRPTQLWLFTPDVPELMEKIRKARDHYLQWGREKIGWAVYLFVKDPLQPAAQQAAEAAGRTRQSN